MCRPPLGQISKSLPRLVRISIPCLAIWLSIAQAGIANDSNQPVSYRREILPLLTKLGCNSGPCHGNLTGKGGLKLSLRGENPAADWLTLTHESSGRRLSRNRPESSLILAKPAGELPHEGGVRFKTGDVAYRVLSRWIAQGAVDDKESGPQLTGLSVTPSQVWLEGGQARESKIRVRARWSNGSETEVTDLAGFDIADPTGATISPSGQFSADRPGEWVVGARYLGKYAVSRLVFLEENAGFVWAEPRIRSGFDRAVFDKLRRLRRNPASEAAPETLVRRVYLDLLGVLPTGQEVRAFVEDKRDDRYERLVDQLLERPEFAEFWALKWSDLLRNEPKVMGPKGNRQFYRWLRDRFAADEPMDQFARELITTTGSSWKEPASAFHRTNRDPETAAETFAQVFLGYRFQCAKCHNHVSDVWTQDDYYGLAANFANLRRKDINNVRRDRFDKHEFNGDVIVHFQGRPEIVQPRSGERLVAKPPGGQRLSADNVEPDAALEHLATWLTSGNRQFARNLANRVWFQLIGRGVVDPVDDFRDTNPPSNPELLDELAKSFVASGYRLKPLAREIVTSTVYRLDSLPASNSPATEADFGRAIVKLLPAEVLRDIVDQAAGYSRPSETGPLGQRAAQEAVALTRGEEFMRVFGKPERLLSCECERSDDTTLAQAFQLINGDTVRDALESQGNRIDLSKRQAETDPAGAVEALFLATLSRRPTEEETVGILAHLKASSNSRRSWEDILWATLNAKEFLFRH
jgi:hypothetical protein